MMMSEAKSCLWKGNENSIISHYMEMFNPHPKELKFSAIASLRQFVETTKGKCSCVSLLFDEPTQAWKRQPTDE